jgi:hypothetical protein
MPPLPALLQFGAGYVLSRLSLLSTPDKEVREERCRLLVLLGHLLKLQLPQNGSLRAGEGGKEALAQKLKMAVSSLWRNVWQRWAYYTLHSLLGSATSWCVVLSVVSVKQERRHEQRPECASCVTTPLNTSRTCVAFESPLICSVLSSDL